MSVEAPRFHYTANATEGAKYQLDLTLKDIAVRLRQEFKQAFPDYRFSVTKESYSMGQALTVALMQAPAPVFEVVESSSQEYRQERSVDKGYAQLNHYQLIRPRWDAERVCNGVKLTETAWQVLKQVVEMVEAYNYDDSDSQQDYFHSNFHFHLHIGKWNQPVELKSPGVKALRYLP